MSVKLDGIFFSLNVTGPTLIDLLGDSQLKQSRHESLCCCRTHRHYVSTVSIEILFYIVANLHELSLMTYLIYQTGLGGNYTLNHIGWLPCTCLKKVLKLVILDLCWNSDIC